MAAKSGKAVRSPRKTANSGMTRAVAAANADDALRSFAIGRETVFADAEIAVAEALGSVRDIAFVSVDPGGIAQFSPRNLFQLKFSSPAVGLDDARMPCFLQNLAVMFDSRVGTRILHEIAPVAAQRIGQVSQLISLWQADPKG